jgi:hypothetical protein
MASDKYFEEERLEITHKSKTLFKEIKICPVTA